MALRSPEVWFGAIRAAVTRAAVALAVLAASVFFFGAQPAAACSCDGTPVDKIQMSDKLVAPFPGDDSLLLTSTDTADRDAGDTATDSGEDRYSDGLDRGRVGTISAVAAAIMILAGGLGLTYYQKRTA